MNTVQKLLPLILLTAGLGLQIGCDQNDAVTASDAPLVLGKGADSGNLGDKLVADTDFKTFRQILIDGDQKARLRHFKAANLKRDLAFARRLERKGSLSDSDRTQLAVSRGLSLKDLRRVSELRGSLLERFPEIASLSETELHDILAVAGIGNPGSVGKTLDQCDDCNYVYNTCVTNAQARHAIELLTCALLVETVLGATICYLGSVSKYMWSISSCSRSHQYCLSNNGCLNPVATDTA